MERDLMLRKKEQTSFQVWRYGEKPIKTPRRITQCAAGITQCAAGITQCAAGITQSATQFSIQNKKFTRDDINTRMGDRDLLVQVGGNPFLSNNNYITDIANRDQYLLARDSNFNQNYEN